MSVRISCLLGLPLSAWSPANPPVPFCRFLSGAVESLAAEAEHKMGMPVDVLQAGSRQLFIEKSEHNFVGCGFLQARQEQVARLPRAPELCQPEICLVLFPQADANLDDLKASYFWGRVWSVHFHIIEGWAYGAWPINCQ